jgi:hypothetical protein
MNILLKVLSHPILRYLLANSNPLLPANSPYLAGLLLGGKDCK